MRTADTIVPRQHADHRGAAGQPARPRAGLVPRQHADHRGAAGQPARPRAGLVPRQRADHRGAAGQPARPRAGLAAPVPQLGAAAAVPPFEPGALPRIAVPVGVELPAGPIELAPLALTPFLQRVAVSGVPLLVFEAWLGASG